MYNQMTKSQSFNNLNTASSLSTMSTTMTGPGSPKKTHSAEESTLKEEVEMGEVQEAGGSEDRQHGSNSGEGPCQIHHPKAPPFLDLNPMGNLYESELYIDEDGSFNSAMENISPKGNNPLKVKGLKVNRNSAEGPLTPPSTTSPGDISSSIMGDESPDGEMSPLIPCSDELGPIAEEESLSPKRLVMDTPPGDEDPEGAEEHLMEVAGAVVGPLSPKVAAQNCTQGVVGASGESNSNQSGHNNKVENHMFTTEIHLIPGDGSLSPTCETSM